MVCYASFKPQYDIWTMTFAGPARPVRARHMSALTFLLSPHTWQLHGIICDMNLDMLKNLE